MLRSFYSSKTQQFCTSLTVEANIPQMSSPPERRGNGPVHSQILSRSDQQRRETPLERSTLKKCLINPDFKTRRSFVCSPVRY